MNFLEGGTMQTVALIIVGVCLLLLAFRVPRKSLKILGRLGLNCVVGLVLLTLLNAVSFWTGLALPVNALTVAASAAMGAPGVLALLAVKIFV